MVICIDARHIEGAIRGIGTIAKNIIFHLSVMDIENTYVLLVKNIDDATIMDFPPNFSLHKIFGPIGFSDIITIPTAIHKIKPDIVWFPANNCSPFISKRTKIISTICDIMYYTNSYNFPSKQWFGSIYRKVFSKIAFKRADVIHTISNYNVKLISGFSKRNEDDFFVTYLGVNSEAGINNSVLDNLNIRGQKYLYTISGTNSNKNLLDVIKGFMLFRERYSKHKFKLVITGVNNPLNYTRKNDIPSDIIFTSYITETEKNSLLKNCALFLFLSRDEGFGHPPGEATKYSKKMLLSDIPVLKEVYSEVALFSAIDNIQTIADDIEKALESDFEYNNTDIISKLDWSKAAGIFLKKFGEIVL